ncbi:hypothetical protein DQ384_37950 [Sphaerisporangium album]|uniref:Uncharacterized protein n=1 Tax=Sphaerisporangium album TaxID=509200 RepID=A0A367EPV5_9ACTN|nr:hypothetical protein [Sphaerisporangium album]RCG20136.1 hypothetical protein DQ384_37950 [Sphaerisporangium album]
MTADLHENAAQLDKRTIKPPRWLFLGIATLAALISFYLTSVPYIYAEALVFMFLAWSLLGLIWIIRVAAALWINRRRSRTARPWLTTVRWLLVPLIFAGSILTIKADVPFQVRFRLSQSSLEHYAAKLAQSGRTSGCQWVGLYYVCGDYPYDGDIVSSGTEAVTGGAQIMVNDWPIMMSRGFFWLPDGRQPPDDAYYEDYKHLVGPWWGIQAWDGW